MSENKSIVNSWNEWDPLKHVIVGRADGTCIPAPEPALDAKVPEDSDMRGQFGPRTQDTIDKANQLLNDFSSMLEKRGIKVDRPTPINFDQKSQTPPSQLLTPIEAYACGIMAWNCKKFRDNMDKYGAGYHGGNGSIGFYELTGYSTVDIDNEEDFELAEAVINSLKQEKKQPEYYNSVRKDLIADANVKRILSGDGVILNNQDEANREKVMLSEIIEKNGRNQSWSHTVVNSSSNSATLIAQLPGEGNRKHFHPDWNEWWYIVEGQWNWNIEGEDKTIQKFLFLMSKN